MKLEEFKILKEDGACYHVGHPNGKKFTVEKSKLNGKAQKLVEKLKGSQHLADGGEVEPEIPQYLAASGPAYQGPPMESNSSAAADEPAQKTFDPQAMVNNPPMPEEAPQEQSILPDSPQNPQNLTNNDNAGFIPSGGPQDQIQGKNLGVQGALEEQKGFMTQEAQAEANRGYKEARALSDTQKQIDAMPTQQDIIDRNRSKEQALFKAFADKDVDPNRLFHNKSTGAKISAGIGLLLGGFGSGLTHQPNQAAQMMKDMIERDIDAQKNDQSKAMNLWKMNKEALGDDLAANLATRNQMYTALKYKIMQSSSEASGPIALARAGAATSVIDQQIAQNRFQMSMMQQGMGAGEYGKQGGFVGKDPSMLVPQLVKDPGMQKKVFDEIQRAQVTKKQAPAIMEAFDKAVKDQVLFSKNALPGQESVHLKSLKALLGPTFQTLEGTVRQAAMDNFEHNIAPAILDRKSSSDVKRAALSNYLTDSMSAPTAKGYGIDLSKFESTATPDFNPVKTMGGVQYKKVEGGWQKVK